MAYAKHWLLKRCVQFHANKIAQNNSTESLSDDAINFSMSVDNRSDSIFAHNLQNYGKKNQQKVLVTHA